MRQQRELWLGRGSFDQLSAIVRRQTPIDAEWRRVRYMIFELPNAPGSFTDRAGQIKAITAAANLPWLQAIPQFRLPDAAASPTPCGAIRRRSVR